MARARQFVWLLALLSGSGCAAHLPPGTREFQVVEYVFGAFGGAALDVRDVCPDGEVADIAVRRNAGAYVASVATLGFYLPHQIRVRCRPPRKP